MVAAQAVDLREIDLAQLGAGVRVTYAAVRRHAAFLDEDRPLGPDADRIAAAIAAGGLAAAS